MQLPPLTALRAFHAVAEQGSYAAAAAELAVSNSAICHQIRNLERCVGLPLVARNGRGIRLTEDGRALAGGLAEGFSQIHDAVRRLHCPLGTDRLGVTAPPIFASTWLVPRLERFKALRPETEIVLVGSHEPVGKSSRDEIVIDWGSFTDDGRIFAERLSGREEVFPVCAPGACPGPGLTGAMLLSREVVGQGWKWPDWPTFLAAAGLTDTGTVRGVALTAPMLLEAVLGGQGVILSNTTIARDDLAKGRLMRPIAESLPVDEGYWVLTPRSLRSRPEVRAFVSWLKEEFARDLNRVT